MDTNPEAQHRPGGRNTEAPEPTSGALSEIPGQRPLWTIGEGNAVTDTGRKGEGLTPKLPITSVWHLPTNLQGQASPPQLLPDLPLCPLASQSLPGTSASLAPGILTSLEPWGPSPHLILLWCPRDAEVAAVQDVRVVPCREAGALCHILSAG